MSVEDIEKRIKRLATRSYWVGVALGLVFGFGLGFAVGYSQGDKTIVIPLTEGIKT